MNKGENKMKSLNEIVQNTAAAAQTLVNTPVLELLEAFGNAYITKVQSQNTHTQHTAATDSQVALWKNRRDTARAEYNKAANMAARVCGGDVAEDFFFDLIDNLPSEYRSDSVLLNGPFG